MPAERTPHSDDSLFAAPLLAFVPPAVLNDEVFVETAQATGLFQAAFDGSGEGNPAGAIWAWESPYSSQISVGEENNLNIRVYGEKGGLEWKQMEPNTLIVKWLDKPMQIYRTGSQGICAEAQAHTRVPAGQCSEVSAIANSAAWLSPSGGVAAR